MWIIALNHKQIRHRSLVFALDLDTLPFQRLSKCREQITYFRADESRHRLSSAVLVEGFLGTQRGVRAFDLRLIYPGLASDEGPLFGTLGVSIDSWQAVKTILAGALLRRN